MPLLPACVFVIRDTVSSSETFLLGKFVREPNSSWTGAFVNRGSTVLRLKKNPPKMNKSEDRFTPRNTGLQPRELYRTYRKFYDKLRKWFHTPKQGPGICLLLLLLWRYSPGWALASITIRLQTSRSLALSLHSFIPIFLRSVDTSSSPRICGSSI
jgi:hypothetical protein